MSKRAGFSIVELIIIIAVVVVIGLLVVVGYNRWQQNQMADQAAKTSESTQNSSTEDKDTPVPEVNSTSDLDSAATSLDQTDVGNDTSELDSQSASF